MEEILFDILRDRISHVLCSLVTGLLTIAFIIVCSAGSARGQCPWQREVSDLQSACLCAYNLGHELSVQCDQVDFPLLLTSLDRYARNSPLDLLYVNNSTIPKLDNNIFANLEIHNIQLSGCRIRTIAPSAFRGQERVLKNLNLQDNDLTELPIASLRGLQNLQLLDLSKNRLTTIPDDSFSTLSRLATLKLSDQNVTLSEQSLRGLEGSLKNLNLKGTRQKTVPECVRGMRTLAFLDLSQNALRDLPGRGVFSGLASLTALNLERNLIQSLGRDAFSGIRGTLSSLSLLNNLLPEYPTAAIGQLKELRVLDIGFNLLTELPDDAFLGNPSITLLALDGNPLSTVPMQALAHLNKSLRGLSLGGRFLHCDCRLRWVTEWIRNGDLQVTSRERNPQFCGTPPRFRDRGFYSIQPEELTCNDRHGIVQPVLSSEQLEDDATIGLVDSLKPTKPTRGTTTARIATTTRVTTTEVPTTAVITTTPSTTVTTPSTTASTTISTTELTTTVAPTTVSTTKVTEKTSTRPPWRQNGQHQQRPPLVLGFPPAQRGAVKRDDSDEVLVKNAFRQDNSVIIQWDSDTANILGFRVVYRLFGDKSFKQGPPLEASEREFKIKNVPPQECIIVCVISLEEVNATPDTVPHAQCREVRTVGTAASSMDKITIAASAAICGTIVIAVIVFVAASRRRSRKMAHSLHNGQHQDMLGAKNGLPIAGLPVNCCVSTPSPAGPLSSLATLSAFNSHKVEDWDQVSGYSGRSIPRPRVYPLENNIADDLRSHASHFSSGGHGPMSAGSQNAGKSGKARSLADGQSQHSFSNHSGRYLATNAFPSNLVNSRPELRQSRQSLTNASDRMSRSSYPASMHGGGGAGVQHTGNSQGSRRNRPRSRSREQVNHPHNRPGSRYSTAGSTHTLNNYCDTSDNWTDHDMDIYMARNPTTRGGLVPL